MMAIAYDFIVLRNCKGGCCLEIASCSNLRYWFVLNDFRAITSFPCSYTCPLILHRPAVQVIDL